jgi:hypothetical protein
VEKITSLSYSMYTELVVRQTEILTAQPSHFEPEIATGKLKKYKSPGTHKNSGNTDSSRR